MISFRFRQKSGIKMESPETKKEGSLNFLLSKFEECDDYRDPLKIEYSLSEILFLTFCALVSGSESYQEIVDFGDLKLNWLRKFSPYVNGIPSHDTVGRILSFLNTKQLEKALTQFSSYGIELATGAIINIDGKWLGGSATIKEKQTKKRKGGRQAVNMVNVYCSRLNSCLGSIRVSSKTVEKSALSEILTLLDLSYCIITLDAGYCYQQTAQQIVEAKADYVIGLKANQPKLLEAAQDLLKNCPATELHLDEEKDSHGRLEQRSCKVLNFSNLDREYKDKYGALFSKWVGLQCLIMVVCHKVTKSNNKSSAEARFYISSQQLMPKRANEIVRGHWHVENCLHWVLDVIFGEDRSTKRSGDSAQNFSILRKMAFNKLKSFDDPKVSMKRRLRKCALDEQYMEKVLEIV
jgi:predicted transposase YbfD/YdcC